jgi:hypothetical protein
MLYCAAVYACDVHNADALQLHTSASEVFTIAVASVAKFVRRHQQQASVQHSQATQLRYQSDCAKAGWLCEAKRTC